jgi:shikimate dehydrogenase
LAEKPASIDRYAVVGNPVAHSLSPQIHRLFAEQTQQSMSYEAIELAVDEFPAQIRQLQQQGLKGANVTVPFKQQAWEICQQRSTGAELAGAVNTLVFGPDGEISGDNTDGVGLVRDLINNHQARIEQSKILILGAGGAARGVLAPLFEHQPEGITIANRTLVKAEKLALDFSSIGKIHSSGYDDLGAEKFDLIINATAAGLSDQVPPIPEQVLDSDSICYDMMYNLNGLTAFVEWAQSKGITKSFDGLGMLVEQAAESFYIWRGLKVNTAKVFKHLGVCRT